MSAIAFKLSFNTKPLCPYPCLRCFLPRAQVIKALHYLQSELRVMHRDVKPSNILISRDGQVKICDYGISGHLVDSVAKTIEAGCKPYMAVSGGNGRSWM
jgi:serine/threonine protein kinase